MATVDRRLTRLVNYEGRKQFLFYLSHLIPDFSNGLYR